MKRILTTCLLLAWFAALALPAHAELVFGPWQPRGDGEWIREVQDGEHIGTQQGKGEDAEHLKTYAFSIPIKDAAGNILRSDSYHPDGTLYYSEEELEDGSSKYTYYDDQGDILTIRLYKTEGDNTTIKDFRKDGSLHEHIVYQGNEHNLDFIRTDGKVYDKNGQQIAYWDMVHTGINEQGGWVRKRSEYTMDGRKTREQERLYPDPSRIYITKDLEYQEDGRLVYLMDRDFYNDIINKRWLAEEADGSFKITLLTEGPKLPEGERPVLADAWYLYQKDGTFINGQELDLETQEMKAVTEAPDEDPLRDNWLGIIPPGE